MDTEAEDLDAWIGQPSRANEGALPKLRIAEEKKLGRTWIRDDFFFSSHLINYPGTSWLLTMQKVHIPIFKPISIEISVTFGQKYPK